MKHICICLLPLVFHLAEPLTDQHYILPAEYLAWPDSRSFELKLEAEKVKEQEAPSLHNNGEKHHHKHKDPALQQEKRDEGTSMDKDKKSKSEPPARKANKETQNSVSSKEFAKQSMVDISNSDNEAAFIPSNVTTDPRQPNQDTAGASRRSLEADVARWDHQEGLDPLDSDGCGTPVCALIDARPKRFASLCNMTRHLSHFELVKQFFHVQKGDCANAIEGIGADWIWGNPPKDDCAACANTVGCKEKVCVAFGNKAKTYKNVCNAMKALSGAKETVLILFALGDCKDLLSKENCLFTEWFDVDEPCNAGDIEGAAQNLAVAAHYAKTGRFRMCPRIRQVGDPQFQTTEGGDIPKDQIVEKDLKNSRLVCRNKDQMTKPGPPYFWFSNDTKCRDYKARHCCKCLYGCSPPDGESFQVDMPPVKQLFEECDWRPFVSNEAPQPDTWDGEDRATALTYGTSEHVCGGNLFDAMFIDARRRDDDVPWDETGEFINKNTPWYGFLCINKNNKQFGLQCSDYKVRYCCLRRKPAEWGTWSDWSTCSASCGGGTQSRDRVCVMKEGNKETCFGNWIDKTPDGEDKFVDLKKQVHKCNELGCPEDSVFTEWRPWDPCPVTCGQARRRRRRGCDSSKYGGKDCPDDKTKYEEWEDCKIPSCPDPQWTKWTTWSQCSLTCGLGKKRRERKCEDAVTKLPLEPGLDCLGGGFQATENCKLKDCPIDGQWTEWLNWGECSILCGKNGKQTRRRYCAQPLPQFGGKECTGEDEQDRKCTGVQPCPQHCDWSFWGSFSDCSVTCGYPGEGIQTRGRHIAVEAKFGGRQCTGKNLENRICPHEKMSEAKVQVDMPQVKNDTTKPIYYCPVDCIWSDWQAWSTCPDCLGDASGVFEKDLSEFEQVRQRKVKTPAKYRGKQCKSNIEMESQRGKCTTQMVRPCPVEAGAAYVSQWMEWGPCVVPCGQEGKRTRKRQCMGGEGCKDEMLEEEMCRNFCPPEGWSQWENWSNCPVTCGFANRARRRFCRDDDKDKHKGNSTCRGIARETQRCDMGKCGSRLERSFEGGKKDPIAAYMEKAEKIHNATDREKHIDHARENDEARPKHVDEVPGAHAEPAANGPADHNDAKVENDDPGSNKLLTPNGHDPHKAADAKDAGKGHVDEIPANIDVQQIGPEPKGAQAHPERPSDHHSAGPSGSVQQPGEGSNGGGAGGSDAKITRKEENAPKDSKQQVDKVPVHQRVIQGQQRHRGIDYGINNDQPQRGPLWRTINLVP